MILRLPRTGQAESIVSATALGAGLLNHDLFLFPPLTEAMIAIASPYGSLERVGADAKLSGEDGGSEDFFILLEGELIFAAKIGHAIRRYVAHERGQFSGELSLVGKGATTLAGFAHVDSQVVRISRRRFRDLVTIERGFGQLVMSAFIHRRMALGGDADTVNGAVRCIVTPAGFAGPRG